ncbi:MAG: hypothetical protein OWV35_05020 [Firmicutes bacterium]|nr:hypothetical protein [Bacillota bacterium]
MYYIGIDGGGTRSEGVLTDRRGRVLRRAWSGPASWPLAGPAALQAVAALWRALTRGRPPMAAAVLGLAGLERSRPAWTAGLNLGRRRRLWLVPDYRLPWAAAGGGGPAAVAVLGTGSVFLAADGAGFERRLGGYGWRVGDPGSGESLGRQALGAALAALEGAGPATALAPAALALWRADSVPALLDGLYRRSRPRPADFTPALLAAAAAGDPVAGTLIAAEERRLRPFLEALTAGPATRWPLVLAGGLGPFWEGRLRPRLPHLRPAPGDPAATAAYVPTR